MSFKKIICLASIVLLSGCTLFQKKPQEEVQPLVKTSTELSPQEYAAWMANYGPKLEEAVAGTVLELTRNEKSFMITMPVDSAFNKDRPKMLMPMMLGPISRVTKLLEHDAKTGVIILGHSDKTGDAQYNIQLSQDRARAVAAIFNLGGVRHDRMLLVGMGDDKPRSAQQLAQNRRVELIVTPKGTLSNTLAQYRGAPYGVLAAK